MKRAALVGWIRRRLTPGEYFGLQLTLGALAFLAAAWVFGILAEDVVRAEPITQIDEQLARWFQDRQTPGLQRAMTALSWLHTWPVVVLLLAFIAYLHRRQQWAWVIIAATAVGGGAALNTLLKLAFHRERPTLSGLATALHTYSFPSGHTLAATVIYGVLALYLSASVRSLVSKSCVAVAAAAMVCLVACSRIYLGVHYLSDVLAAMAEGIAWLSLCYVGTETFVQRKRRRDGDKRGV